MQIAKAFYLNVKRHLTTIIIYLGVFTVLLILFSNSGVSADRNTFEASKMNIIVIDEDKSVLSSSLYDFLSARHTVSNEKIDQKKIGDELYYQNTDYVLTIPRGFEKDMMGGNYEDIVENIKLPKSTTGYFADVQIEQYLSVLSAYTTAGYSKEAAAKSALNSGSKEGNVTLLTKEYTNEYSNIYYFFPYILICVLTLGIGLVLMSFREKNLNARIQCSAVSATRRNLQLTLCTIIFSVILWGLLQLIGMVSYPEEFFSQKGLLYLGNSFVFLMVSMSIAFLASMVAGSSNMLNMIANVVGLGLSFLGGIFVPMEFMSKSVLYFSRLLPSYWYITAVREIQNYEGGSANLAKYGTCLGIQFLFAAALLAAALVAGKQRRLK